MSLFSPEPRFDLDDHGAPTPVGVLLANLGTPDAPTPGALRRYLKQFLWDPRVVEQPRIKWWLILHLFILTTRPRKSAALYRKIWTEAGSPLIVFSHRLADAVSKRLSERIDAPTRLALGMRYGQPSIAHALAELRRAGCRRLLCLPLYPQYSATTTASTFDALFAELSTWRAIPELRTVRQYHDEPGYIDALTASIRELWDREGEPDKLLFSFHGIPLRYFEAGDPYPCQCRETARLVAERLALASERYRVSFQSIFGREKWVEPATDAMLVSLAREGTRRVDVLCPGFAADCLETLEEIDQLNRELFTRAGGERFRYIPCLNDRPDHAAMLAGLLEQHLGGWAVSS
ncbi:MAG: ferrochelatase [Acidobacteriota bacterium]|nr:MAG: ferrochelatase [Acidobacteriota bacterium]